MSRSIGSSGANYEHGEDLTIYVFVNEELQMEMGASCAQVAHAVAQMSAKMPNIVSTTYQAYALHPNRVVVLTAKNSAHLQNILQYCDETLGIHAEPYIDEGYECTMTAVATQPIPKKVGEVFRELWRYGYNTKTKRRPVYPPINWSN
ncbi:MAG: hypothetical protein NC218_03455 [Acetobacter sp.]|nr:hypothetical protein [Acetobacter sp.]